MLKLPPVQRNSLVALCRLQVKEISRVPRRVEQYHQQRSPLSASSTASDASPFTLPIYSQELGSLPIHPSAEGQTVPQSMMGVPHQAQGPYNAGFDPSTAPGQMPIDGSVPPPINSALEAWITLFAPTQYQQPPQYQHAPFTHSAPPGMQQPMSTFVGSDQTSSTIRSPDIPSESAHTAATELCQRPGEPFDSDTLAMWSTAPSSFA